MSGHKTRLRVAKAKCEHKACRTMRELLLVAQAMLDEIAAGPLPRLGAQNCAFMLRRKLRKIGVIVPALLLAAGLWQADAQTNRHIPYMQTPFGFHHVIRYAECRILIYTNHTSMWLPYRVWTNAPTVREYMAQWWEDGTLTPACFTLCQPPARAVTVTAFSGETMFCQTNPPGNQWFRGVQFPITTNLWRVDSTTNLSNGFQTTVGYCADASTLAINQTAVAQ